MFPDSSKASRGPCTRARDRARAREVPRALRELVNRRAHAELAAHYAMVKAKMTAEIVRRLASGERAADIASELRGTESGTDVR